MLQLVSLRRNHGRRFHLYQAEEWGDMLTVASIDTGFVLLLAADTSSIPTSQLIDVARIVLSAGARYVCAWGPDCERVHDAFDRVIVDEHLESGEYDVIMTTWHDSESLREAAWFFRHAAIPAEGYRACADWIAISAGNSRWTQTLVDRLPTQAELRVRLRRTC